MPDAPGQAAPLSIRRWPDPALSAVCAPVGRPVAADFDLARAMLATMYAAPGRGLAAPQIGVLRRLFVMDVAWKDGPPAPGVYFDPEVLWVSDEQAVIGEGCLSIPGIVVALARPAAIGLRWTDEDGARREAELQGAAARCAQHEIDHLDGIVTLDRLDPAARTAALAALGSAQVG